jgi:hypothetical protein
MSDAITKRPASVSRVYDKRAELCELLRKGEALSVACGLLRIPRSSVYWLRERDEEFDLDVAEALAQAQQRDEMKLDEMFTSESRAVNSYLHRMAQRYPETYRLPSQRLEHTGADGKPMESASVVVYVPSNARIPQSEDE